MLNWKVPYMVRHQNKAENRPSRADLIILCQQLERGCMQYSDPEFSLELSHKLCSILCKEELANSIQSTLDRYCNSCFDC
jgi:hypothetical protein